MRIAPLLLLLACHPIQPTDVASCGTHGLAGPDGLDLCIDQEHPRLWWDDDRLTAARSWADDPAHAATLADAIADEHEATAFDLALNGVLHDDEASCQAAIDRTMAYHIDAQTLDEGPCDTCRWEPWPYVVYDWCYKYLKPAQHDALLGRFSGYVERVTVASQRDGASGGLESPVNNYFWGYLRNEVDWGIAAYGEDARATDSLRYGLIDRWQEHAVPFLSQGQGRGGVGMEGSQYGVYMQVYSLLPFTSVGLYGFDALDQTSYFREAVLYWIHTTLPAPTLTVDDTDMGTGLFPFADDERSAGFPNIMDTDIGDVMTTLADHLRDVPLGGWARTWLDSYQPPTTLFVAASDRGGEARPLAELPLDHYAAGPGMLFARNHWGADATVLQATLGRILSGGGHDHQDMGSFQLWRAGRWLSKESTLYATPLDWGTSASSWAHNTVTFRVPEAWGGRPFGAVPGLPVGDPVIRGLASTQDLSWAAVDLTPAYATTDPTYEEEDHGVNSFRDHNPYTDGLLRELVYLRELDALIVLDRVAVRASEDDEPTVQAFPQVHWAADDVQAVFNLHVSRANPTIANDVLDADVGGGEHMRLHALAPADPEWEVVDEMRGLVGQDDFDAHNRQWRVEVRSAGGAHDLIHVVEAVHGAGLTARVDEDADQWVIHLSHATLGQADITLLKHGVGGSVSIGGQNTPLAETVQGYRVEADGPVWE